MRGRGHHDEPRGPRHQDQHAAEPPGEARTDWEIIWDLARRLGRGAFFPYRTAREIFDELRVASSGGHADYYGITWEKIDAQQGVFWPCPTRPSRHAAAVYGALRAPGRHARACRPIVHQPPAEEPSEDYPFRLTSGRVVYHYLSGNQTRRIGFLFEQAPEPWVEIHPRAAEPLGIHDRSRVRVRTPRGSMELNALVSPTMRPDTIFIPFHYAHSSP